MKLLIKTLIVFAALSLLSGCVATGIRVGNVYIPVDTGIGKEKKKEESEEEEEQGVERGLPPKSKSSEEDESEDDPL